MENAVFESKLIEILGQSQVLKNEPMRRHTSFRVGGEADYYVMPKTEEAIADTLALCREAGVKTYIVGNCTNLLISDKGLPGLVIEIGKAMSSIKIEDTVITAQAGALLANMTTEALGASLSGLEFASGIPGTLGGAIFMNAGAYGGEMKDVVVEARVLMEDGTIKTMTNEELGFGYRTSSIEKNGGVVLSAKLRLIKSDAKMIMGLMTELRKQRRNKQPLDMPSAGSAFKRPEGYFAAKLIDDAGLRGHIYEGAQVSEKHAGFIINMGFAKASDIYHLIYEVQDLVRKDSGVTLEPEIRMIGEFE
ncbi:MAG: UDP-N-acetylmuramate dehydrogenase [Lachnospiraceae bacterium]|nr:UDP-N-acetylmuramate dehydrogenase [Candidatus Equihabitans merdae]